MNLKAYTQEEILAMDDRFIFDLDGMLKGDWKAALQKRHLLAGGICIFIGIYILFVSFITVSYTHLDVYKRQRYYRAFPLVILLKSFANLFGACDERLVW